MSGEARGEELTAEWSCAARSLASSCRNTHNITQVSYVTGVPFKCLNTNRMVQHEKLPPCFHNFLLFFCESQRLPEIKGPHIYSEIFCLCQSMSCLLGVQAHCPTISIAHTSSFSAELLLLSSTSAGKPHEGTFPHIPHVTAPHTVRFSYNTAYLCEEENVAQLFISSEGSAKSNSKISREAFVLKVASSC